jgi:hypothetical protein
MAVPWHAILEQVFVLAQGTNNQQPKPHINTPRSRAQNSTSKQANTQHADKTDKTNAHTHKINKTTKPKQCQRGGDTMGMETLVGQNSFFPKYLVPAP